MEVPLGFFAVVGCGQGRNPAHTWVQALGDAFDHATFARRVTAFKQNDHAVAGFDHPVLQHHQLRLEAQEFTEVAHSSLSIAWGGVWTIEQTVIKFKLELFVHAVEQVFTQLAQLFFGDLLGHDGPGKVSKVLISRFNMKL